MPEGEARWIPDPTRRHELRWWNGTRWTEHVNDGGRVDVDWGPKGPPATRPRPRPAVPPDDIESPGLLEESPERQRERERRQTFILVVGAVLLVVAATVVVLVVTSSGS